MSDSIGLMLGVCVCVLTITVLFLSHRLVHTNTSAIRWAGRCMDHACAFNEDQRSFMRDRFIAENARPPADTGHPHAGHDMGVPMPPNQGEPYITAPIPYEG